jgi:hypothetical protein
MIVLNAVEALTWTNIGDKVGAALSRNWIVISPATLGCLIKKYLFWMNEHMIAVRREGPCPSLSTAAIRGVYEG